MNPTLGVIAEDQSEAAAIEQVFVVYSINASFPS